MENSHQVSDHLEPWRHLHGKVVMVTGASSGLGRDFCLDLAKAGCRIVAAARRIDRLQSVCDQINQLSITAPSFSSSAAADNIPGGGPRAVAVELDVSADGPAIEKSVNTAWDAFGRIDALVNNAGIRGNVNSALELSEEEWNHVFRTNLRGSWLVSKFVAIRMRDADRGGSIVNISSIAGLNRGYVPGATAYNCSKVGLNTLTKTMAMELGVHKIRVNAISPGLFRSEITERLMQKEWLHNVAMKTVPLRTYGTSDPALTSLLRYLLHDSSEYVSGNIYIVDAGTTLTGVSMLSGSTAEVGAAALVEEASAKVCIRDVDCDFLIKCNPGDLKLCRDGKCVCIPKSAVAVEEGEPQCRHYRDCEYKIDCKPGKLKSCFVGECVCVTDNRGSPPTHP